MTRSVPLVLALLLVPALARGAPESRPKIFLEKKIFAETTAGRTSYYEVHTVSEGETLWRILQEKSPLFPSDYSTLLREFRRANPKVADPGMLVPGQKILVPSGVGMKAARLVEKGETVAYRVKEGDSLTKILTARGVARKELARYVETVKELNDSVHDVNVIYAGKTILLPTDKYYEAAAGSPSGPRTASSATPPSKPPPAPEAPAAPAAAAPAMALTREAPPVPGAEALAPAKPESQLAVPAAPVPPAASVMTVPNADNTAPPAPLPAKPSYRGLLSDVVRGLGETWVDQGTLYLPLPTGGEVVLNLDEYPVVRFSGGIQALIDFRGALPEDVRRVITETWKNYRVVSMDGAAGPEEMIDRLLRASGYHSVRGGLARPPVIGEQVSVALPARWVILKTSQSLLSGEIILVKKVPEKPGRELSAVLRYAEKVGIRVVPYAFDPAANEGFVVGIEPPPADSAAAGPVLAPRGLKALDDSLALLGIPASAEKRIRIGGAGQSFLLTVQPDRTFEAGGARYVVDSGRMSPALLTIVRNSGYRVFPVGTDEPVRSILRRLFPIARFPVEDRKDDLLAGGKDAGFEVRATGTFLLSPEWLAKRNDREAVLVRGKVHSATKELLREIGVEIVEW